jgi:homoserine kinase
MTDTPSQQLDHDRGVEFWNNHPNFEKSASALVPGSAANLGPGFDTLALALGVHLKITIGVLAKDDEKVPFLTTTGGAAQDTSSRSPHSFVQKIMTEHLALDESQIKRMRILLDSQIPPARGFGSSAAISVGTLWTASKLNNRPLKQHELLARATAIDGHPDNAAASLLGGLAISAISGDKQKIHAHKLPWPEKWQPVLVKLPYRVATAMARKVLPKVVLHSDATYNVQHTALLLAAVQDESEELLKAALQDRLHEKYRAELIPELPSLRDYLHDGPALGCVLSGAGSSLLVLTHEKDKKEVVKQVVDWTQKHSPQSTILEPTVDQKGLQEVPAS